ncbi:MAG TPA: MFS transporter [Alphaproteobacteria bacterium]|jgi:MFS family permease|nr:MFS transporter [Alphaproteobacteria bacterium]
MDASTTLSMPRRDFKVLSLVCGGHFVSHFYMMVLPPLFPLIHADLGLSYLDLGFLLTARYVATGVAQIPIGFMVDRFGAKIMLMAGLMVMVLGYALFALASNFWILLLFVVLGGAGDSVFHPSNYSILNASVSKDRMGRAFSVHTFSGHIGFAVGPAIILPIAVATDWRTAMMAAALFGFAVMCLLLSQWRVMREDGRAPAKTKGKDDTGAGISVLLSRPVLLLFFFFTIATLAGNGISAFSVSALVQLGTPEALAGLPLSAFMLSSAFAVLAGGLVADKDIPHDTFAALGFTAAAIVIALIAAVPMPYVLLVVAFGLAGFCLGVIRPARDLMVRDVAPAGSSGKVFGFVFSGQNVGGALAPPIYGALVEHADPHWVFYGSAVFLLLGILTVTGGRRLIGR